MQVLTVLIIKTTGENLFSVNNGCSAIKRLSIYADYVNPFVKPTFQGFVTVKEILQIFDEHFGLKV
jgi:hypothetical protein